MMPLSSLWLDMPADIAAILETAMDEAIDQAGITKPIRVFFRADDVGVPSVRFKRLMTLFQHHHLPLSLAVVPSWLTEFRWKTLKTTAGDSSTLWCWHQHGWRHVNHEAFGKKSEFGSGRNREDIVADLVHGRHRLQRIMGPDFYPAFTPPWNRSDTRTLQELYRLKYHAVSRGSGICWNHSEGLPDIGINIDLHTRKEHLPETGWHHLVAEIREALSGGFCGIMIHHQRMNEASFRFLDLLCAMIARHRSLKAMHLKDLVQLEFRGDVEN